MEKKAYLLISDIKEEKVHCAIVIPSSLFRPASACYNTLSLECVLNIENLELATGWKEIK